MAGYRRLISYIYAYEGEEKGKNIGFVKLESRNGQCRLSVNVKKVYVGGNDIGVYNTCGHLCKYCYANANKVLVIENMKKHNENSPFLIGNIEVGDKITEAKQKSWIVNQDRQISFI